MADRYYYLAPWEWITDPEPCWHAPEGVVGLIDLRPLAETNSYGFFVSEKPLANGYLLGRDLQGLERNTVSIWNDTLKLNAQGDSILDLLAWTLDHGDPDGASLCPPLMPTHQSIMEIHLGGHSLVRSRAWLGESDPAWPSVQAKLQRDYREIKRDAEEKASKIEGDKKLKKEEKEKLAKAVRELSAKWLGASELKFKVHGDLLIPGNMAKEPARKPTTSYADSFNRADATSLGTASGGWAWGPGDGNWNVEGNRANPKGSQPQFALVPALSSADHYSQLAEYNNGSTPDDKVGCVTRAPSNGSVGYMTWHYKHNGNLILFKYVGSFTALASGTESFVSGAISKLTASGSSLTVSYNGTARSPVTDTSYPSNLYAGITGREITADTVYIDDFLAADLIAAAPLAVFRNHYRQMGIS